MKGDKTLLEKLPEVYDADLVEKVLLENLAVINEFCGQDMGIVIENFAKEQAIPSSVQLSDRGVYFGKECTGIKSCAGMSRGYAINPRDVVWSLYLALEALGKGKGIDPDCVIGWQNALLLTSLKYMTFQWVGKALYPAFRWEFVEYREEDRDTVVSWIKEGRRQIAK